MFNITKDIYKKTSLILPFIIKIHLFLKKIFVVTFSSNVICELIRPLILTLNPHSQYLITGKASL